MTHRHLAALVITTSLFAAACVEPVLPKDAGSQSDGGVVAVVDGGGAIDSGPLVVDAGVMAADASVAVDSGVSDAGDLLPTAAIDQPALARGSSYRGFTEKFNRHYTEPTYAPKKVVYVSPTGGGSGMTHGTPTTVAAAFAAIAPGTRVHFNSGTYSGCYELAGAAQSGTYADPIVLYGERGIAGAPAVVIDCCATGRATCINLEAADYVAVDGFELNGGSYGVRAVGADYAATQHQKGIAVLNVDAHNQSRDPFLTGASDWYVIERSRGHNAGAGDGHGIYLSNGSDWNIVRLNELWNNASADFQINADPASCCTDIGIDVASPECDAVAGTSGEGGRGASDFMLVESNYFHHGLAQGANFTSARNSIVRNNIFAFYARHGVSFWQETTNPRLGASDNFIAHNLFVANVSNRQMLQFVEHSERNVVENNLFVGDGATQLALEVDATVSTNRYTHNAYYNATLSGRTANATEFTRATFDPSWFRAWPSGSTNDPTVFQPSATAPFIGQGDLLPAVTRDRAGTIRTAPTELGPFKR